MVVPKDGPKAVRVPSIASRYLDIIWGEISPHAPALRVIDRAIDFSTAKILKSETAEDVWNAFVTCPVNVYVGFQNVLTHDQGKLFTSDVFHNACVQFVIIPKQTPTESHKSLGARNMPCPILEDMQEDKTLVHAFRQHCLPFPLC